MRFIFERFELSICYIGSRVCNVAVDPNLFMSQNLVEHWATFCRARLCKILMLVKGWPMIINIVIRLHLKSSSFDGFYFIFLTGRLALIFSIHD